MNQAERTRRSRARILEAALELFSRHGFRGTSVRDIADAAGLSTGSVYHQFSDKESIFHALLDQYWQLAKQADYPLNKALLSARFPDDLDAICDSARESIEQHRHYIKLIYVDVVEFEGRHVRHFYAGMAQRFERFIEQHPKLLDGRDRLREDLDPGLALMLVSRVFLQYFAVELLFGVDDHFGRPGPDALREIADILRRGMVEPG